MHRGPCPATIRRSVTTVSETFVCLGVDRGAWEEVTEGDPSSSLLEVPRHSPTVRVPLRDPGVWDPFFGPVERAKDLAPPSTSTPSSALVGPTLDSSSLLESAPRPQFVTVG